jgi:hypothetical protein
MLTGERYRQKIHQYLYLEKPHIEATVPDLKKKPSRSGSLFFSGHQHGGQEGQAREEKETESWQSEIAMCSFTVFYIRYLHQNRSLKVFFCTPLYKKS